MSLRRAPLVWAVALGLTALAGAAAGQAARPAGRALTIEDYYRIQLVGGTRISPDGRWVAFTVSTRIEDDNSTRTETWLVATDGSSEPTRLLHYGRDVERASWTDDSRLTYTADGQPWTIAPAAPSGTPVVGAPPPRGLASRDGAWLAVTRDHPQPRRENRAATDFERRHAERFEGVIFDWKDFQRDGQPFPAPDPTARPAVEILLEPAGGGAPKTLVAEDLRPSGLVWHPDGRRLAFVADSHWRDPLTYERSDLWMVTIDGELTRLTDDGYVYGDVDFSPDGRYLAYSRSYGTDRVISEKLDHGGPRDLYVRPVAGGEPVNLTADWDLDPGQSQWSPDGRHLYFTAGIGGESHLFRVSVPEGRVEQITTGPRRLGGLTIDRAFRRIAYTVGVHDRPPDVYVADIDGSNERRLTDVHRAIVGEIAFSRAERLEWPSYDGTRIEGWLLFPYGYDPARGPYPLIVTSHGGPHSATGYGFDFKDQLFAASGYFVFDTNFRSSTGYGDAFKWATWGAWGQKDGEDVMSGIDVVLKRYPLDPARVGHTGHSYGGFMTNWLITQYPDRFAAAITGAGITNWMSDYGTADIYRTKETEFFGPPWDAAARDRMIAQSPLSFAGHVRTPTLFVHGEADQRVPYEEGEQMYFALRRRGVPAKMIRYAGQPHGIGGHWNNVHRMINELAWWNTYLAVR